MTRIALFPGTFDPPTIGHLDIIKKGLLLVDHLIIAVAVNPKKSSLFSQEERLEMLRLMTAHLPHIEIAPFHGLIVDFAKQKKAHFLLRGLRAFSDFETEFQMALANRKLGSLETLFLLADETHTSISSSLIREILHFKGPIHDFVTPEVETYIKKKPAS